MRPQGGELAVRSLRQTERDGGTFTSSLTTLPRLFLILLILPTHHLRRETVARAVVFFFADDPYRAVQLQDRVGDICRASWQAGGGRNPSSSRELVICK